MIYSLYDKAPKIISEIVGEAASLPILAVVINILVTAHLTVHSTMKMLNFSLPE